MGLNFEVSGKWARGEAALDRYVTLDLKVADVHYSCALENFPNT